MENSIRKTGGPINMLLELLKKYVLIFLLIICVVVFTVIQPVFISWDNIVNILAQNAYIMVAMIGMAIIMISGGVDLSAGYLMSFVCVATSISMKWLGLPIGLSIIIGLVVGVLLSTLNGYLSVKLNIHSMMATLATMTLFQGIGFMMSNSESIFNLPDSFKFIGQGYVGPLPLCVIIMTILLAVASFFLNKTYYGRYIYAIGSNAEATRLAGINLRAMKVIAFTLGGLFFGIAAILLLSRTGSANAGMATGTEFTAITACVVGGVSLKGGEGKLWGAVVGVLILGVLSNGMQVIGMGTYPQYIAKGIILLAAMGFDTYQKMHKKSI